MVIRPSLILVTAIAGCSAPAEPVTQPNKASFILTCSGIGQVTTKSDMQTKIISEKTPTQIIYRYDNDKGVLETQHLGVNYSPFCTGPDQEICKIEVTENRLLANNLDMFPGKISDQVSGFEEHIDIDRTTMIGSYLTKSSVGTFTETEFKTHFKVEVRIPLICR